jgi:hypothetical protein
MPGKGVQRSRYSAHSFAEPLYLDVAQQVLTPLRQTRPAPLKDLSFSGADGELAADRFATSYFDAM